MQSTSQENSGSHIQNGVIVLIPAAIRGIYTGKRYLMSKDGQLDIVTFNTPPNIVESMNILPLLYELGISGPSSYAYVSSKDFDRLSFHIGKAVTFNRYVEYIAIDRNNKAQKFLNIKEALKTSPVKLLNTSTARDVTFINN